MKERYCQVGGHVVSNEIFLSACAVCHVTFCSEHEGNDPSPGQLMACPNHTHQVDGMNKDNRRRFWQERDKRS